MSEKAFQSGFRAMIPFTTGVIPFGAVMGAVCADAGLGFWSSVGMNVFVFAGAAQLAAVDLMTHHASEVIVVATGLVINLRFLLYSAALSPLVERTSFLTRWFSAYSLTDQNYALLAAHQDRLKDDRVAIRFYLGASCMMAMAWHGSVMAGYAFGNVAPAELSLDFAVPLSFASLLVPALKSRLHVGVAVVSTGLSLVFHAMPYRLGLITTAVCALALAAFLTRSKPASGTLS